MGRRDSTRSAVSNNEIEQCQSPLEKRSCTDVLCLILFVAFIGVWTFVGSYAYNNNKLQNFAIPTDSHGLRCGIDAAVKTKPYVADFDFIICVTNQISLYGCATEKVCVEKCPDSLFLDGAINMCTTENFATTKANLVCLNDKTEIKSCHDVSSHIKAKLCSPLTIKTRNVFKRCLPDFTAISDVISKLMNNSVPQNNTVTAKIKDVSSAVYDDVVSSQKLITGGILASVIASIIFIAVLRWLVKPIVWGSLIGCALVLAYCVVFSWTKYAKLEEKPANENFNYLALTSVDGVLQQLTKPLQNKKFWLCVAIGSSVVAGIVFLIFLVLRSRISLAIGLIKEGSKAVSSSVLAVFFPLIPWILSIVVLAVSGWLWLALGTIGENDMRITSFNDQECVCQNSSTHFYYEGATCEVKAFLTDCQKINAGGQKLNEKSCRTTKCESVGLVQPNFIMVYKVITLFGAYWGTCFAMAFGEMVLASTFATWYWTMHKSEVPRFNLLLAVYKTIRYHLGTLAFGSLLLAICKLARDILNYIETKAKMYDNFATRAILCLLKGLFWCLEKFLKFFNTNVYIVTAINGTGFCTSAKDAFGLLTRNVLRSMALTNVTGFLFFLSKLFVSMGMGASIYQYTMAHKLDFEYLNFNFVPALIVAVVTYVICCMFFSVYGMAVDTIFLCFLIDCEKNDGSQEKRYFMSKSLMSILGKKYQKTNLSRQNSIKSNR